MAADKHRPFESLRFWVFDGKTTPVPMIDAGTFKEKNGPGATNKKTEPRKVNNVGHEF